jgi:hypothetical protein
MDIVIFSESDLLALRLALKVERIIRCRAGQLASELDSRRCRRTRPAPAGRSWTYCALQRRMGRFEQMTLHYRLMSVLRRE